jgi:hypothetical protein
VDDDDLGIFEFLAQSTKARIAHYRHRAADIRARAEAVSGARRVELLKLAEEFEELAGRITMNRRAYWCRGAFIGGVGFWRSGCA